MKTRLLIVLLLSGLLPTAWADAMPADSIINWQNGNLKQSAQWSNGLVVSRKLYNKKAELIEWHQFDASDIVHAEGQPPKMRGVLRTYYDGKDHDTARLASVMPVVQYLDNGKYVVETATYSTVTGYYQGTKDKRYTFSTDSIPVRLKYDDRYNTFYNDIMLYDTRSVQGLNAKVTWYDRYGVREGESEYTDGRPFGMTKTYYPNNRVRSEGRLKQTKTGSQYYVGKWLYYYDDGVIEKELEFFDEELYPAPRIYLATGALIDTAVYYFPNGKPKYIIAYPGIDDAYHRIDTLEAYYNVNDYPGLDPQYEGQLHFKYEDKVQMMVIKAGSTGDKYPFFFSGRFTEYYPNGIVKTAGYVCKRPRRQLTPDEQENILLGCVVGETQGPAFRGDKFAKKVGWWYYFDESGQLTSVIQYRLCGMERKEKEQLTAKKIEKLNEEYQANPNGFIFVGEINDNE